MCGGKMDEYLLKNKINVWRANIIVKTGVTI